MRPFAAIARGLALAAAAALLGAAGCGSGPGEPARPGARAEPAPRAPQAAGLAPKLVLAGDGELWVVDVDAQRARHYEAPQLPGGDPPHRVIRRGDRFVLWGAGTFVAGPRLDRRHLLRPLERASRFFLPSANPERLWLFTAGDTAVRFAAAREVTPTGHVTVTATGLPRGWPERAARSGLLFSPRDKLALWDPRTRSVVNRLDTARIGDLGPIHGDTLASCVYPCRMLRFTDVRTGAQRRLRAPRGLAFEPYNGAFSSTGSEFAVPVAPPGSHGARRLGLVRLDRPAVKVIRGTRVPQGYVLAEWSRDDAHVFMSGGHADTAVIVDYRRDRGRARRLHVKTGPFYDMAAR